MSPTFSWLPGSVSATPGGHARDAVGELAAGGRRPLPPTAGRAGVGRGDPERPSTAAARRARGQGVTRRSSPGAQAARREPPGQQPSRRSAK